MDTKMFKKPYINNSAKKNSKIYMNHIVILNVNTKSQS